MPIAYRDPRKMLAEVEREITALDRSDFFNDPKYHSPIRRRRGGWFGD
jgi:hypothetical protein